MAFGLVDDWEEEDRHEKADTKSTNVGKVVDSWYESECESDDDLDDEIDELADRPVLDVPVRQEVAATRVNELAVERCQCQSERSTYTRIAA